MHSSGSLVGTLHPIPPLQDQTPGSIPPHSTHVPLLKRRKTVAHSGPLRASRLATMFLSHSRTLPRGSRYFHRAGLLFPMVVSSATCRAGSDREGSRAGERSLRARLTHQPAAENIEVIHREDGARVGREHLDAPRDLRLAWRGDAEGSEGGCEAQPPQPSPRTAGRGLKGQRVLLDDAQHGLVGAPGVVGHQQVPVAWQQLHQSRAGARAQDTLRGGAVQGRLQVLQVTPQLQQPGGKQSKDVR